MRMYGIFSAWKMEKHKEIHEVDLLSVTVSIPREPLQKKTERMFCAKRSKSFTTLCLVVQ